METSFHADKAAVFVGEQVENVIFVHGEESCRKWPFDSSENLAFKYDSICSRALNGADLKIENSGRHSNQVLRTVCYDICNEFDH